MRALGAVLVALWAATAVVVAAAYRPGGPVDIVVVLACFPPVLVAAVSLVWPPLACDRWHVAVLVWIWIFAILFTIPVLYGVSSTLALGGPQNLVPSFEAAYAGILALCTMCFFSVVGFVHQRRGRPVFDRAASLETAGLALLLTVLIAFAFGLVALINDQALRRETPLTSRYGPTDPDLVPPLCDEPAMIGPNAVVTITARSSEDNIDRGRARLDGRRAGDDEVWGGSWSGLDGNGQSAYLRIGTHAWLNEGSDDPEAPGHTWQAVQPGLFAMAGESDLTMDGPPHAIVSVPRGSIVPEDLGLEVLEGARARHCRTFVDGPTALSAFMPLRWLLTNESGNTGSALRDWRGEIDWWVFADGQIGRASTQISGRRSETGWRSEGVRGMLEAVLDAVHRTREVDVTAPAGVADASPLAAGDIGDGREASPPASAAPSGAIESPAP